MRTRIVLMAMLGLMIVSIGIGAFIGPQVPGANPRQAGASSPTVLAPGEAVQLGDGTRLRFLEVVEDSRCPMDAICIWAGEAILSFALEPAGGKAERFTMRFQGPGDTAEAPGGYSVVVVEEVQPYPMASQPTSPEEYRVTVVFAAR